MKLIAYRPAEEKDTFYLWYVNAHGSIIETVQKNIKNLFAMLVTSKTEGVKYFDESMSPEYITGVLKYQQSLKEGFPE